MGRNPNDNRPGSNIFCHNGPRTNYRAVADSHPIRNYHVRPDPDVFSYADTFADQALMHDVLVGPVKAMIRRDYDRIGGDAGRFPDGHAPMPINDGPRIETDIIRYADGAAVRCHNGSRHDGTPFSDYDTACGWLVKPVITSQV
jgi:hypothetical protein